MQICDLIEYLYQIEGDEVEFYLISEEGATQKLSPVFIDGKGPLYHKKDKDGDNTNVVVLGLNYAKT